MTEQTSIEIPSKSIVIGYWHLRGRIQAARLILQYLKIPYVDVNYSNPSDWFGKKKQEFSRWTFVDLPYLLDGYTIVTQPLSIVNYIIKRSGHHSLLGQNLRDQTYVDMYNWYVDTLIPKLLCLGISRKPQLELKKERQTLWNVEISEKLNALQACPGYSEWFLGYLTVIDFSIYQLVHYIDQIYPGKIKKYSKLIAIEEKIRKLQEIQKYQKSQRAIKNYFPGEILLCEKTREKIQSLKR